MNRPIYVVRDPRGNVCGASCFSDRDTWNDARSIWAIHSGAHSYPSTGNGYTCETIAPPSAHDAAIVAAAEAAYDAHVVAAHCPCTEGLCRHDTDAMYQDGELHDAVLAKREASV